MERKKLITWYLQNHRILPWRETKDPYIIWLSEVILQQTRVAQGLPYFEKFVKNFPDVHQLAKASEEQVLKLWQGLGYYSRGRNLHYTAKYISTELNGKFPENYLQLKKLKGVGSYTAAAIASFAYKEPIAVLDGNVFRVLSRYYAIDEPINGLAGKKIFEQLAKEALDAQQPDMHNQAMMELGALVCTPVNPQCSTCPLKGSCLAYQTNRVLNFPVKIKKNKAKEQFFNYFHLENRGKIALYKRPKGGIWQNLYDLPLLVYSEFKMPGSLKEAVFEAGVKLTHIDDSSQVWQTSHILTHIKIKAAFFRVDPTQMPTQFNGNNLIWVSKEKLHSLPVSRLLEKYLQHIYG
jgi:A/G-specific adenine glycosylase